MKIKVGVERTINLGNYENIRPSIVIEDEVEANETPEKCHLRLVTLRDKLFEKDVETLLDRIAEE